MNKHYLVTWEIDIEDFDNPVDAAKAAFGIMQREGTEAVVFTVKDVKTGEETTVDLLDEEEENDEAEHFTPDED